MDPLSIVSAAVSLIQLPLIIAEVTAAYFSTAAFIIEIYGVVGIFLIIFGSKDVLRSEFQVLASSNDQVATDFKKAAQDESTMIAVTVSLASNFLNSSIPLKG